MIDGSLPALPWHTEQLVIYAFAPATSVASVTGPNGIRRLRRVARDARVERVVRRPLLHRHRRRVGPGRNEPEPNEPESADDQDDQNSKYSEADTIACQASFPN